jgi:hypothetical protein
MADEPVDLDRERRIRDRLRELSSLLTDDPALAARTLDALEGRIPAPDLEDSMNDAHLNVRLPRDVVDRLDALVPLVANDPRWRAFGRVTRSTVLRLAVDRGLGPLEAECRAQNTDGEG